MRGRGLGREPDLLGHRDPDAAPHRALVGQGRARPRLGGPLGPRRREAGADPQRHLRPAPRRGRARHDPVGIAGQP
ncbi:MAG: hypothetical protein MZU95_14940 [Desulfomicrobium escambiense]|nr:hypothetical protein [Desulfomicrobium escambiense]